MGEQPGPAWLSIGCRALGIDAASAVALFDTTPAVTQARSYLVTTAGGSRVKVRRAWDCNVAARAQKLTSQLGDARVPAPIARSGRVTAEVWVEGTALAALPISGVRLDRAARLLSDIHGYTGTEHWRLPRRRSTAPLLRYAQKQIQYLIQSAALSTTEASLAAAAIERGLPSAAPWGIVHYDYCADNLVERPDGELTVVDNETTRYGFFEQDLARTEYRWAMTPSHLDRFEAAYRSAVGGSHPAPRERSAWRCAAAVHGMYIRRYLGAPVDAGAAMLRRVLADVSQPLG